MSAAPGRVTTAGACRGGTRWYSNLPGWNFAAPGFREMGVCPNPA